MSLIGLLIVVAMLVCLPMLVFKNPQVASLDYYFGELALPLSHLLLVAFVVGFVASMLILLPLYLRLKFRIRKARKRIIVLEKDAGLESTVDSITRSRGWQKRAARRSQEKARLQEKKAAKASTHATPGDQAAKPQPTAAQPKSPGEAN